MNTAFKFEIGTDFYEKVADAIEHLIKTRRIGKYRLAQVEDVAWRVHKMDYNALVNKASHFRRDEWVDIVWFSYADMINLLRPFLDEIDLDEEE